MKKNIAEKDNTQRLTQKERAKAPVDCCALDDEVNRIKAAEKLKDVSHEGHNHDEDDHNHDDQGFWFVLISLALLLAGLAMDHLITNTFFEGWIRVLWYAIAYIPVGYSVVLNAMRSLLRGQIFTEFLLMTIATIGAFAIGEYPEGVAVMLFYTIGELFQMAAVRKARSNIEALLDVRSDVATVFRNKSFVEEHPSEVEVGAKIQVKVGERIPLDGILLSEDARVNSAALTGESKPQSIVKNGKILAGSINLEKVIELQTEKLYDDSSIARILELVQDASSKKAKTELLIRRLAKVYTPIVAYLAMAICILPYFFVRDYVFADWLYRALVFLVISCPCALVISIPLGYFGGLGAASKNGILFKGATYLDQLNKVNTVVMDKTGTVTKGVFQIKEIINQSGFTEQELMSYLAPLESKSTHPIAKAILEYHGDIELQEVLEVEEIAGKGLKGKVGGKIVLAGNQKLMDQYGIETPAHLSSIVESIVLVSVDSVFAGYVTIADELKEDAQDLILSLKAAGINEIVMLSGDKASITQQVAIALGIERYKGELLPEEKLREVEKIKEDQSKTVAFIGDGINDAPVLAVSDVGIAMGALGSDVAIETADIVIQTDQPSKVVTGMKIAKSTQRIIWQNIALALGVKVLVLILGAGGLATMWEAVFADVGVALLAILNAVRIQRMKF